MTARQKALDLCQKFGMTTFGGEFNEGKTLPLETAKQCAIIVVDEIINLCAAGLSETKYWLSVKQEISSL